MVATNKDIFPFLIGSDLIIFFVAFLDPFIKNGEYNVNQVFNRDGKNHTLLFSIVGLSTMMLDTDCEKLVYLFELLDKYKFNWNRGIELDGHTLLREICQIKSRKAVQCMKYIVETKNMANVINFDDKLNNNGWNYIHYAIHADNVAMVEYLLALQSKNKNININMNATCNHNNNHRLTVLHLAQSPQMFQMLVKHNKSLLDIASEENLLPIHYACNKRNTLILEYIIKNKLYINDSKYDHKQLYLQCFCRCLCSREIKKIQTIKMLVFDTIEISKIQGQEFNLLQIYAKHQIKNNNIIQIDILKMVCQILLEKLNVDHELEDENFLKKHGHLFGVHVAKLINNDTLSKNLNVPISQQFISGIKWLQKLNDLVSGDDFGGFLHHINYCHHDKMFNEMVGKTNEIIPVRTMIHFGDHDAKELELKPTANICLNANSNVKINNWTIVEQIGSGGFGAVYLGVDSSNDHKQADKKLQFQAKKQVAIKFVNIDISDSKSKRNQLIINEIEALTKIQHGQIVSLLEYCLRFEHAGLKTQNQAAKW